MKQDETDGSAGSSRSSGISPPPGDAPQLVITQQPRAVTSVPSGCNFGATGSKSLSGTMGVEKAPSPAETAPL